MYDDALSLLAFTGHMFQSHKARKKRATGVLPIPMGDVQDVSSGERDEETSSTERHEGDASEIPLMDLLEEQVRAQEQHFENSLKQQLASDIHLPACVKIVGYLRRLGAFSEEQIRALFLEQRGIFIGKHKVQIERNMRANNVTCLRAASDLMRTHVGSRVLVMCCIWRWLFLVFRLLC